MRSPRRECDRRRDGVHTLLRMSPRSGSGGSGPDRARGTELGSRAPAPRGRGRRRDRDPGAQRRGQGQPDRLLHGWMDNADTWRAVLQRLGDAGRPGIAYDLPGFGTAPPLEDGSVLDQLVEFAAAAVELAAADTGHDVVVAGNSLGGWAALRLAELDLPLAGVVPIGPAGIRMAPTFFTLDRVPAVSRLYRLPAPVPEAIVRSIVGRFYRVLAFAEPDRVDQAVVDRFTRQHTDRSLIGHRLEYAKRLKPELEHPFEAEKIERPGDGDLGRERPPLPARRGRRARRAAPAREDRHVPGGSGTRRRWSAPTSCSRRSRSSAPRAERSASGRPHARSPATGGGSAASGVTSVKRPLGLKGAAVRLDGVRMTQPRFGHSSTARLATAIAVATLAAWPSSPPRPRPRRRRPPRSSASRRRRSYARSTMRG